MGIVKSQLSPFNWKTILILVFAVGAILFAFRTFGKFNTAPEAVAEQEQEQPQQMMAPPPQYEQQPPQQQLEQPQPEEDAHYEQDVGPAASNE